MKSEGSPTPAPSQPATPAPTQAYTTQWSSAPAMAIDPTLQQQTTQHPTSTPYYSAYTSHYPQAAYATHYQSYAPPATAGQQQAAQQQQVRQPVSAVQYQTSTYSLGTASANTASTSANAASSSNNNNSSMDTADIATLNDALGSAGVDLRAEEESLQRTQETHQTYRSYEDRTRKQPPKPAFDNRVIGSTMRTIGTTHKITRIPEESVTYLALSLRARLQDLITAMIAAANHRTDTTFDRPATLYEDGSPMWSIVVRSDIAKQLAALEKVEREEETRVRKERKERAEMTAAHAAALAAQANGAGAGAVGIPGTAGGSGSGGGGDGGEDTEGNVKKKRKKEGPGVTARNMSEDVRKKMSNAVATQAAGLGGKYSWMTAANAATPPPKSKAVATPAALGSGSGNGSGAGAGASSWARPYVSVKKPSPSEEKKETPTEEDTRTVVTMRDAMFIIEKDRGHGGGRGAARGWV